jgi:hypothetical protein
MIRFWEFVAHRCPAAAELVLSAAEGVDRVALNRTWAVILIAALASGASFVAGHHTSVRGVPAPANTDPGTLPMSESRQPNDELDGDLACRLSPDELNAQRKQLIPGLFQRADKVEDIPNGIRFRFTHRPKLVTELASLIEKERVCCSFLTFRLTTEKGEGPVTLEVSGPPGTAEMLKKL